MEPELPPRAGPDLDQVIEASKKLGKTISKAEAIDSAKSEKEAERTVKIGSIVRIEYLGDHPQTKLVLVVDEIGDKKEVEKEGIGGVKKSDAVDYVITSVTALGKEIIGQPVSDKVIDVFPKARIRIMEIIDP